MDKFGETVDRSGGRAELTDIGSLGKALGLMTLPWFQLELFADYQWDIASHLTLMWPSLQATMASPMMP